MPTVQETVFEYLNEIAEKGVTVTNDLKLIDDLGLDSLDVVEMTIHIEEKLGITIDDDNAVTGSSTVGDLIETIKTKFNLE